MLLSLLLAAGLKNPQTQQEPIILFSTILNYLPSTLRRLAYYYYLRRGEITLPFVSSLLTIDLWGQRSDVGGVI